MVFNLMILLFGCFYFILGLLPFIFIPDTIRDKVSKMSNIQIRLWGLVVAFSGILLIYLLSIYLADVRVSEILKDILPKLPK